MIIHLCLMLYVLLSKCELLCWKKFKIKVTYSSSMWSGLSSAEHFQRGTTAWNRTNLYPQENSYDNSTETQQVLKNELWSVDRFGIFISVVQAKVCVSFCWSNSSCAMLTYSLVMLPEWPSVAGIPSKKQ